MAEELPPDDVYVLNSLVIEFVHFQTYFFNR